MSRLFLVSQGCAVVQFLCDVFLLSFSFFSPYGVQDEFSSLSSASVLFTHISDSAVSLQCDLSSVWVNADKMTQCKYEM